MSFILSMAENMLGLTAEEQATLEPLIPHLKEALDIFNKAFPDLWTANALYVQAQPIILRILGDYKTIGPNASALLGDQFIDISGTISAAKDIQAAALGNPRTSQAAVDMYNKLYPVIQALHGKWPVLQPGFEIILNAFRRKGLSSTHFMNALGRL